MTELLEVTVYTITVPVVIGVGAFLVLLTVLGIVRTQGKFRPHS